MQTSATPGQTVIDVDVTTCVALFLTNIHHLKPYVKNPSHKIAKNITIHHECPCRIEISYPRGRILTRDEACRVPGLIPTPRARFLYPTRTGS